jgi:hypothetical protein
MLEAEYERLHLSNEFTYASVDYTVGVLESKKLCKEFYLTVIAN